MTDISALSDADLLALARGQASAPTAGAAVPAPKALADMTDDELRAAHTSVVADMAKSAGIGLVKGAVTGTIGLPGTIKDLVGAGVLKVGDALGLPRPPANAPQGPDLTPRPQDVQGAIEQVTGPFYQPKTKYGKFAETIGEFAPGALLGPGGTAAKLTKFAVIPGAASEAAGQATEGTRLEPYARVAAALLGTAAGAGAGRLATAVQNRAAAGSAAGDIARSTGEPVTAGAVRRLGESAEADRLTGAGAAARVGELGPEAMVLDLGRQLRGRAEAIAAQPGAGQSRVLDAVEGRTGVFGDETARRVRETLDQNMGPSPDLVATRNHINDTVDRVARPLYDQVMTAHPVVQVPAAISSRPVVAQAMRDAVTLARNYGEQLSHTQTRTVLNAGGVPVQQTVQVPAQTSLRYWDYVKKAIDARIRGMMQGGGIEALNSAEKADLGGLQNARTALVQHLDTTTNNAYRNARQAAATKFEVNEAIDLGRNSLNTRLLPEELAEHMQGMSIPERAGVRLGMRREIERIMEVARNDGAAARRLLDTNSNRQKIATVFSPRVADAIERRISAETTFQEATQDIARNSRTAVRRELIKDTETPSTGAVSSVTIPGMVAGSGRAGLNWLRGQGMSRTRDALGTMLSASGGQRDDIVRAILGYQQRRAANALQSGSPVTAGIAGVAQSLQDRR